LASWQSQETREVAIIEQGRAALQRATGVHGSLFELVRVGYGATFNAVRMPWTMRVKVCVLFGNLIAAAPTNCSLFNCKSTLIDVLRHLEAQASIFESAILDQMWLHVLCPMLTVDARERSKRLAADMGPLTTAEVARTAAHQGIRWMTGDYTDLLPADVLGKSLMDLHTELRIRDDDDDDGQEEEHGDGNGGQDDDDDDEGQEEERGDGNGGQDDDDDDDEQGRAAASTLATKKKDLCILFADDEIFLFSSQRALATWARRAELDFDLRECPLQGSLGNGFGFSWQKRWFGRERDEEFQLTGLQELDMEEA
jgi:hypothetical protein